MIGSADRLCQLGYAQPMNHRGDINMGEGAPKISTETRVGPGVSVTGALTRHDGQLHRFPATSHNNGGP